MGLFSRNNQDRMPKLVEEAGFAFRYGPSDESGRPHVVVTGNGGSALVRLGPVEVAEAKVYCRPEVERILRIVHEHETNWLAGWDARAA
jgi:hypothetical protein